MRPTGDKDGYQRVYHELEPVWSPSSRVLILGSLPSPKSREQGFYYGHPQNRFWKVLSTVLEEPMPKSIDEKKELILSHDLALWDVLESCLIKGASDTSIREPVANDIASLMSKTDICHIVTTGGKADSLYKKLVYPDTGLSSIRLPSTSPANCAVGEAELIEAYGIIKELIMI